MWGGIEGHMKWALVDWNTLCKAKFIPGLWLRDPISINRVVGDKNMVEMDFSLRGTLGEAVAPKICPSMDETTTHTIWGRSSGSKHLEGFPREHRSHPTPQILGGKRWNVGLVHRGCLETISMFS